MDSNVGKGAIGTGVLTWIMAVAGAASTKYLTGVEVVPGVKVDFGIFKAEGAGQTEDVDCGDSSGSAESKCSAIQAFAVIGILAVSASTIVLLAPAENLKKVAVPAAAFACFSFLITFSVMASWYQDDFEEVADLGASFALIVVAWILAGVHTALCYMTAKDGK